MIFLIFVIFLIPMPLFLVKLSTSKAKNLKIIKQMVYYKNFKVSLFEICGNITKISNKSFVIVDLCGELTLLKSQEQIIEEGCFIIEVKPFITDNKVIFFCKSIRKSSIYEEISSIFEIMALERTKYFIL